MRVAECRTLPARRRAVAGEIAFGTVMPWYLLKQPALRWIADSAGKPAGIRGVSNITDRSQLSLTSAGNLRIVSTPTDDAMYGHPAIPVSDAKQYAFTIRHKSSGASGSGLYIECLEKSSALATGKTHLTGGGGSEAICDTATGATLLVSNGAMPGTTMIEQSYVYTPTSGTKFMCLAYGNFNAGATDYEVEWVSLTELGTNINVLPGLAAQTDTPNLVVNSATTTFYASDTSETHTVGAASNSSQTILSVTVDAPDTSSYIEVTASFQLEYSLAADFYNELRVGRSSATTSYGERFLREDVDNDTGATREISMSYTFQAQSGSQTVSLVSYLQSVLGTTATFRNINLTATLVKR